MSFEHDPIPGARIEADQGPGLIPAFTLVVWVACLSTGVTGLLAHPAPDRPAATSQPAVQVVNVDLETAPAPLSPSPTPAVPTPTMASVADLQPIVPTVALPSPAIAFAVPVAGPARLGPAAAAVPVATPVVRRITYGQGEGAQPAPEYPPDARDAGQQGTVTVRFTIDADGRVTRAWASAPSPFSSLNRAAVEAVRDTWRFTPGPDRLYEVPITFRLNTTG